MEPLRLGPGRYDDVPEEQYHADLAEEPSLSGSLAKVLVEKSPWHLWMAHPRLNPRWKMGKGKLTTDIGKVAHRLLFGTGCEYEVLQYDAWTTKASKEDRDRCLFNGVVPILEKHYAPLPIMAEACHMQMRDTEHDGAFVKGKGKPEVSFVLNDRGVWLRCRSDWVPDGIEEGGHVKLYDYKTTERSARSDQWSSVMFNLRFDLQAAMNERIIMGLYPKIKSVEFVFVVQEWEFPHAVSFVSLGVEARADAHDLISASVDTFETCLRSKQWPGYPRRTVSIDPAKWRRDASILRKMQLFDLVNQLMEPEERVDQITGEVLPPIEHVGPVDVFGLLPAPADSLAYAGKSPAVDVNTRESVDAFLGVKPVPLNAPAAAEPVAPVEPKKKPSRGQRRKAAGDGPAETKPLEQIDFLRHSPPVQPPALAERKIIREPDGLADLDDDDGGEL